MKTTSSTVREQTWKTAIVCLVVALVGVVELRLAFDWYQAFAQPVCAPNGFPTVPPADGLFALR